MNNTRNLTGRRLAHATLNLALMVVALDRLPCAAPSGTAAPNTRAPATAATGRAAATQNFSLAPRPTSANCSERFFEQPVDQSNYNSNRPTWQQRFFLCDQFVRAGLRGGPPTILFYVGNEGAVTTAVHSMGLLWELAAEWGALLAFGEHRYYGKSLPDNGTDAKAYRHLSVEQALVDYVKLIQHVKDTYADPASPVIAFGASYGAMLAAWLRLKYPNVVTAALASSAPLRSTLVDGQGWEPSSFWEVVTRAASPAGGAPATCPPAVRSAFAALVKLCGTAQGREEAARQLRLCQDVLAEEGDAPLVALFLMMAFDTAAMSSYPYPSSYFTGDPAHPLPAWPMRVMCRAMGGQLDTQEQLLGALAAAVAVVHNVTGGRGQCYDRDTVYTLAMQTASPRKAGSFAYQVCAQFVPSETFFPSNGRTDMFWDAGPFSAASVDAFCSKQFGGAAPRTDFRTLPLLFGASEADFRAASNIIFSNGLLDPWSSGGFLTNLSSTLPALLLPEAGHHADLFWSEEEDLPGYAAARQQEKRILQEWVKRYRSSAGTAAASAS